ncbi:MULTISPECIES: helix-turn-helix domain-containing protein [Bacillales]|uniref:helix-turn-helix domain-containing protein n=1 Tax=Bacillales TaxID=1385 RepID=UPI000347C413|nr:MULTISPECIES: helix-turn-helix domain-containing protein [Bacillales]
MTINQNYPGFLMTAFRKQRLKNFQLRQVEVNTHVLCYVAEGSAEMTVDGQKQMLEAGKLLLLHPTTKIEELRCESGPLHIYRLHYAEARHDQHDQHESAPERKEVEVLAVSTPASFLTVLEELSQLTRKRDYSSFLRSQALLYELLGVVYDEQKKKEEMGIGAIEETIAYMQKHYRESLELGSLPRLAGLTPSSYCRAFKRVTGMTPGEYLTGLRMEHAKELLAHSGGSVKDLARNVGYTDELYFSRLFKKREGLSPQIYRKQSDQRVVVVSKLFLQDHFLAMGIQPIAAPSFPNYFETRTGFPSYLQQKLRGTKALNAEQLIDPKEILTLSPDVIVRMNFFQNREAGDWEKIRGTVFLDGYPNWIDYQTRLATLFKKESQAEKIIKHIDNVEKQARDALLPVTRKGEWTMIRVLADEVRLYGVEGHALADLFYHKLGFAPDPNVAHAAYKPNALNDLIELNPERIIVFWSEREHVAALWNNPLWRDMRAVRENKVYHPANHEWDPWGPFGREHTIQRSKAYFLQVAQG